MWRGNGDPFCSTLLPRAARLITETLVFGGFTAHAALVWVFGGLFFVSRETGIGGFPLRREVDFVPVLLPKESSGPMLREAVGLIVVKKVKALF